MSRYAENTTVSSDRSKMEIENTLRKYGAGQFISGWDTERAVIGFTMCNRQIKFIVPLPNPESREFTHTEARGYRRDRDAQMKEYDKAVRQRWRALLLVIKAKLEAVETGITEFEDEFMAHIVLPNGQTMGQLARPQIATAYETGNMPPLLGHDG